MLGVAYQTVERWEHNRNRISPKSRLKIIAFIGYDPEAGTDEPTGDSIASQCWIFVGGFHCKEGPPRTAKEKREPRKGVPAVSKEHDRLGYAAAVPHRVNLASDALHELLRVAKVALGLHVQPEAWRLAKIPAQP